MLQLFPLPRLRLASPKKPISENAGVSGAISLQRHILLLVHFDNVPYGYSRFY